MRDFYERFVTDHPDDPELLAELGRAHGRLASIVRDLESSPRAVPYYEKKLAIFGRLREREPDDLELGREVADCHFQIGWGLLQQDHADAAVAEAHYAQARELLVGLLRSHPRDESAATLLSLVHRDLGMIEFYHRARTDRAEPHYLASLGVLEELVRDKPDGPKPEAVSRPSSTN